MLGGGEPVQMAQRYTWTTALVPNPSGQTIPRLILRQGPGPASHSGSPPGPTPGTFTCSSRSSSSSSSRSSSSSSSRSSSSSSSRSSSSSSSRSSSSSSSRSSSSSSSRSSSSSSSRSSSSSSSHSSSRSSSSFSPSICPRSPQSSPLKDWALVASQHPTKIVLRKQVRRSSFNQPLTASEPLACPPETPEPSSEPRWVKNLRLLMESRGRKRAAEPEGKPPGKRFCPST
ncbi:uncharacterized protein LOC130165644 [Seriola aureovittata]|uniref:uncharacterized protein LOC130165644 n=1 Tax=Seriola aureovittata TaxID=2871759 RepID=UPI0024BDF789|nr:uncharacterized protein LOC130165644 [Seriola aureovittata]